MQEDNDQTLMTARRGEITCHLISGDFQSRIRLKSYFKVVEIINLLFFSTNHDQLGVVATFFSNAKINIFMSKFTKTAIIFGETSSLTAQAEQCRYYLPADGPLLSKYNTQVVSFYCVRFFSCFSWLTSVYSKSAGCTVLFARNPDQHYPFLLFLC